MKVLFEESFEKDLSKVVDKKIKSRLKQTIEAIKNSQSILEMHHLKKLKAYKSYFRIRLGEYRMGIEVVEDKIIFVRFLHRKDIYKYFP